jgi:hypothetical protein
MEKQMDVGNEVAVPSGSNKWAIVAMKFFGLLIIPPIVIGSMWGILGRVPLLGYALLALAAFLAVFPKTCNNVFGFTDRFPRLLLVIGMFPTVLFAGVLLIATDRKGEAITAAAPAKKDGPAPVSARPPAPAPAPAPAPLAQAPKVKPEGTLSWSHDTLTNNTSKVLLGATFSCTEYFKNGKVASESEKKVAFVSDNRLLPVVPAESRKFVPEFDFSGNKEDIAKELTVCKISAPKLAELNPRKLPMTIALGVKEEKYSGDKVVATLTNQSAKPMTISALEIACVVRQDRSMTDEEMMSQMKYGNYTDDDLVHMSRYYERLIARPYYSAKGETRLEIPAAGKLDVRLYTKGGLFSSDKEVVAGMDFNSHVCWILD